MFLASAYPLGMLVPMELRHLRYFAAVAGVENVSKAALKLHLSQPALSRQIRDLEEELGVQLLERSAKSVRLTEPGRVFLAEVKAVLERVESAVQAVQAAATSSRTLLNVGYAPTLTARFLPQTLRTFQASTPSTRVRLHDLSSEEMIEGVCERRLDVAFIVRPTPGQLRGLAFSEVAREPLRLAVASSHPLASHPIVSVSEASREPFVTYGRDEYPEYHEMLMNLFAHVRRMPRIVEEHDGVSSLVSAVSAGIGVAIVPASIQCLAARLRLIPLSPAPKSLSIGSLLPGKNANPHAIRFLKGIPTIGATKK